MIKIKVSPFTCKTGDQIADDIFNENGVLVAAKNTVISESIQKSLMNMNINDNFYVFRTPWKGQDANDEPQFETFYDNYKSSTKILEKLTEDLSNDNQSEIGDLDIISNSIFNEITYNQYLVKFLCDIKSHDDYTFEHSLNVAFYSAMICKWMSLDGRKAENIIKTALLHDIGKAHIPIDLLNKKEELCSEELKLIQNHAIYGYNIIKDIVSLDSDVKLGVLLHHERVDGSGYPYKYSGKQLNINSKIVSIADTYDALTSDRVYRDKCTPFMALNILMTEGLNIYDIDIMNTFVNNLVYHYIGSKVLLSSGETAKVIHIPMHNITRPIISVNSKLIDLSKDDSLDIVSIFKEDDNVINYKDNAS